MNTPHRLTVVDIYPGVQISCFGNLLMEASMISTIVDRLGTIQLIILGTIQLIINGSRIL